MKRPKLKPYRCTFYSKLYKKFLKSEVFEHTHIDTSGRYHLKFRSPFSNLYYKANIHENGYTLEPIIKREHPLKSSNFIGYLLKSLQR